MDFERCGSPKTADFHAAAFSLNDTGRIALIAPV